MLPTFIIAGAPKAGTTSLWYYLKSHPQVGMSPIKEPWFFTNTIGVGKNLTGKSARFSGRYAYGLSWYESLFRNCQGAKAIGEASGLYFTEADSPGLIQKHIPGVHLIFLLRDPVERLYSHYLQDVKFGYPLPDFKTLVQARHPALERYLYVSSYHLHLERFLSFFPRQQIKVFLYDDLRDNPRQLVKEVYQFISVDPLFDPPMLGKKYNQRQIYRSVLFYFICARTSMKLRETTGREPPAWWIAVEQTLDRLNSRPLPPVPVEPELRAELQVELNQATEYVECYLDRPLPGWRKV
jgi:Sulfotransferase domain